ncbi:MAG: hypothetical protein U9R25_06665 [Chloroflexota bacterium]|nr:hypothetical protein [Chloroflexota bacterium]
MTDKASRGLKTPAVPDRVSVHIEELILHGFPAADRMRIGRAVERQLARLLADGQMPGNFTGHEKISALDGGSFATSPGIRPEQIGSQIAGSVVQALQQQQTVSSRWTEGTDQ